ncbi:MAG: hypothetical protein ACLQVN_00745 [Bryobacteraceae bacterium]
MTPRERGGGWPRLPTQARAYAPVLLAPLYMLPRLGSAHFGLLDDAVTLANSRLALHSPSLVLQIYESAGRFLPFYWIYWALLYATGGNSPLWFYLGNTALLTLTVAALIALMRCFDATLFETWVAALFFLFSAPVSEAYFTLSKGEPVMVLCILASFVLVHRAARSRHSVILGVLAATLIAIAAGTRETALAAVGTVGIWWLLSFWTGFGEPIFLSRRALGIYLGAAAGAAAVVWSARLFLLRPAAAGAYASAYRLTGLRLAQGIVAMSFDLVRDFPALCLLALAAAALAWRRQLRQQQLLLMMTAWMGCAVAILLPWPGIRPYYLLLFAVPASIFSGTVAGELLALWRNGRKWAGAASAAAAALLGILAIDSVDFGRCQIMVDEANAELLEWLRATPAGSVVLLNIPFSHEYAFEIKLHLNEQLGRPDLRFAALDYSLPDPRDAGHPYYVVSLVEHNRLWPGVRGPMLESETAEWNASLNGGLARGLVPVRRIARTWQMADIGIEAFWCAAGNRLAPQAVALWCHSSPRPMVDLRVASYGWEVYTYPLQWRDPARAASFAGGVWTIEQASRDPITLPLGEAGDQAVAADWNGEGRLAPGVYRPSTNQWRIGRNPDGQPALAFALNGMKPGDVPVAGDWTGSHRASPGFYRPSDATWHLFASPESREEFVPVIHLGGNGAVPLTGDWDGGGRDTPGVYQPETGLVTLLHSFHDDAGPMQYTLPVGSPVVVNWTGFGVDTVNTVKDGSWFRRLANCQCDTANSTAAFSTRLPAGQPFAGRWKL